MKKIIIAFFIISLLMIYLVFYTTKSLKHVNKEINLLHEQSKYIVKLFSKGIQNIPPAHGDLRNRQIKFLNRLIEFDKIAKTHQIEYWLDFGTLIGAVRHSGFIPWDDDIDISMTDDNFQKLRELSKRPDLNITLTPQFEHEMGSLWFMYTESGSVAIDIFNHICTTKKDHTKFMRLIFWTRYFKSEFFCKKKLQYLDQIKTRCSEKSYVVMKNVSFRGQDNVFNSAFDIGDIYPLKTLIFEGYEFPVPNNIHTILSKRYGKYLDLPNNFGFSHHMESWN